MMIGQTGMNGLVAYSPWFDRGALEGIFAADVIRIGGAGTLTVAVEHRNRADTLPTVLGTIGPLAVTGVGDVQLSGVKEEVRFRYTVGGTAVTDWVHWRMLTPTWMG